MPWAGAKVAALTIPLPLLPLPGLPNLASSLPSDHSSVEACRGARASPLRTLSSAAARTKGSRERATAALAAANVAHLIVVGAQTDACIRSTIHGAFTRGYDVTLVSDAHTTEDMSEWGAPTPDVIIKHTNMYWGFQSAPGRTAAVLSTTEVSFSA